MILLVTGLVVIAFNGQAASSRRKLEAKHHQGKVVIEAGLEFLVLYVSRHVTHTLPSPTQKVSSSQTGRCKPRWASIALVLRGGGGSLNYWRHLWIWDFMTMPMPIMCRNA